MPSDPLRHQSCTTCADTGWLCAHTDGPADFEHGTCCKPWESEFAAMLGTSCPSANGCPDCDRAMEANSVAP